MNRFLVALLAVFLPGFGLSETVFSNLSTAERELLHAEIRSVLLAQPEIILRGENPAQDYSNEVAADLELIARNRETLFDPKLPGAGKSDAALKVALSVRAACDDCARAESDLRDLALSHDLRLFLIDAEKHPELVSALGIDAFPFYVMPEMMLRGYMPKQVLNRYLENRTGQ